MTNTIEGFEELQANLEKFKVEARDAVARGVFHGCTLIQNDAKEGHGLDAHGAGRYVDRTGNLTNSIQAQEPVIDGNKISGETVAQEPYAAVVELGGTHTGKDGKTWRTSPYPYMFPAIEKMSGAIVKGLTGIIKMIRWVN